VDLKKGAICFELDLKQEDHGGLESPVELLPNWGHLGVEQRG
jgi:hypothetical protein